MRRYIDVRLATSICISVLLLPSFGYRAAAQEVTLPVAVIQVRAVTPQDVTDEGITTGTATGLSVVGVNTTVYLRGSGIPPEGATITGYHWTITGPGISAESTDAETTFRPASQGVYTVTLVVTDSNGQQSAPATREITAATWVGIENCTLCHSGRIPTITDKVSLWQETGHATMLAHNLDYGAPYYGEQCIKCHTVGYDTEAENGGFDDLAAALGWTFPETKQEGNWESLKQNYPALANLANIQCENCHGPGSLHNGDTARIGVSLDPGLCGFCHDALTHHTKKYEWDTSNHASPTTYPTGPGRESCVPCHSGAGFVYTHDPDYADKPLSTKAVPIGCAICHDPHSAQNEHQIRVLEDVTLGNGVVVTVEEAGLGALCMNCHKSRRNVDEYVQEYHPHYGPHHGPQADMLKATGGYHYPGVEYTSFSPHLSVTEDSCVTCHMAEPPEGAPPRFVGLHTFRISAAAGTIEEVTQDIVNTNACKQCHGEIESANYLARGNYDGDDVREGIQDEVSGLLDLVGRLLPPIDSPEVEVTENYTLAELKAAYNYLLVEEDKSRGVHNPKYAVQLLQSTYHALTGLDVPGADILARWTTAVGDWSLY